MADIGKFCSVAKKGTIIMPKKINGYIEPEGQILEEDGQIFNFIYTPVKYNIEYDFDGGHAINPDEYWHQYNIEQEYIPPEPIKENHTFLTWEPNMINIGTTGDFKFKATWMVNAILLKGSDINSLIDEAFGKENIMSIQRSMTLPGEGIDYINLSDTATPIIAWLVEGCLMIYSIDVIHCNKDMSGAFAGFTILRDINSMMNWVCDEGSNINNLFNGCALLTDTDAVSQWANGNFSDFTGAFTGTAAVEAGRVPSWYRWNVKTIYMSTTGTILEEDNKDYIPDQILFAKTFAGYATLTPSVIINDPNINYTFNYKPIEYNIDYLLNGGELLNPKTSYTIEDETYYPPEPVKPGFKFTGWDPECINRGEYGNMSFIANYINE